MASVFASDLLYLSPFSPGAGRWQAEASDAASCPHTRGEDILPIQVTMLQFGGIQVRWVLCSVWVAIMTLINHRVKELSKHLGKNKAKEGELGIGSFSKLQARRGEIIVS